MAAEGNMEARARLRIEVQGFLGVGIDARESFNPRLGDIVVELFDHLRACTLLPPRRHRGQASSHRPAHFTNGYAANARQCTQGGSSQGERTALVVDESVTLRPGDAHRAELHLGCAPQHLLLHALVQLDRELTGVA